MPTITDRRRSFRLPPAGIAVALAVWFGGMAGLALIADPAAVVAFGPEPNLFRAIAATDTSVLSVGTGFVAVRTDRPGTVRRLYANGAWFVWPVITAGCVPKRI